MAWPGNSPQASDRQEAQAKAGASRIDGTFPRRDHVEGQRDRQHRGDRPGRPPALFEIRAADRRRHLGRDKQDLHRYSKEFDDSKWPFPISSILMRKPDDIRRPWSSARATIWGWLCPARQTRKCTKLVQGRRALAALHPAVLIFYSPAGRPAPFRASARLPPFRGGSRGVRPPAARTPPCPD